MKKILYIIFTISLLFTVYIFADTFGLLESKATGIVQEDIAKWNITINGNDVRTNKTLKLSDFIFYDNKNVETGYFAPGVEGYYDIIINPNDTDVAIKYDIIMDLKEVKDIPSISFEATNATITSTENNKIVFSGYISLDSIKKGETLTIQLKLNWLNDEKYNDLDSTLMNSDSSLSIPVTIDFSQYSGEVI